MGRHQNAKGGAARLRLAFDDAAVVADDLGDQCKTEAGSVRLRGDEGIEEVGQHVFRHAGAVVDHREFERQADPAAAAGHRKPNAGPIGGAEHDLRILGVLERLGGVLDEVQEHLDQLIAVGVHRRKRRIVFLDDADVSREAVAGDHLHPLEDGVDVDGLALRRALVGKNLHAVDEPDDAVGLVADQARQRAVVLVRVRLEQLRRAADAGERVLDLMRQHRGKSGHRARRAAMRELAVDLFRHRARQQHERDVPGPLGDRRGVDIDDALGAEARRADVDAVFGDRRAAVPNLLDQAEDRAAERQEMARDRSAPGPTSNSGRRPRRPGWRRRSGRPARSSRRDAAARSEPRLRHRRTATAPPCSCRGRFGGSGEGGDQKLPDGTRDRLLCRSAPRSAAGTDVFNRSRYQPRCFRAMRTPLPIP